MKFHLAPTEPNFDRLKLVSEGGEWELGLWSVLYGVRVRFSRTGAGGVELDYCAGDDPLFQMELLNAVQIILKEIPETVTHSELRRIFPNFYVRPINLDPVCWPELQRLRDEARTRLGLSEEFSPLF